MSSQTVSGTLYVGSGINPSIILSETSGISTSFNALKQDIDFSIRGTGNGLVYFDASTGRLGVGTGLPDAVLHVVAPCSKDGLIVESITNCPTGVTLLLVHNPQTTPLSGSYPAIVNLAGRDTNYNEVVYGQIMSKILDPVTGSTSGEILFTVDDKGTNKPVFSANLRNVILGGSNSVSGYTYTVVGVSNAVTGVGLTTIGSSNTGISNTGITIGSSNYFNGAKVFALVNNSRLIGANNTALGDSVNLSGLSNIFVGNSSSITGNYNILLGSNNNLNTSTSVGLVQVGVSSGASGVVLGSYVNNSGDNNIYIGNVNTLIGNDNSVVGSNVSLSGNSNKVYGSSDVITGTKLICIGSDQTLTNISSGIFVGNNINLQDTTKSIVIGLGNSTNSGLDQSILLGINNNIASGIPSQLLLIGQANVLRDINGSLVVGNTNNLSGTVSNNLVLGSVNAVPPTSNNNLVVGILNNQTGVYINSVGTISGTPSRTAGTVNNSIIVGINNLAQSGNSNVILGNKNVASGSNISAVGSYNNLKNASNAYAIGNSNFLVGDQIGTVGSKIAVVGQESMVFNTANTKMDVFGSGNIVVGYNQMVSSGIIIGTANKLNGINNIVYGRDNTLGSTRNQCVVDSVGLNITVPTLGITSKYLVGDKILLCVQSPPSVNNTFVREISNVVENSIDNTTVISIGAPVAIDRANGYYSVNNAFDDNNSPNTTIVSGLVMPYQRLGGAGGTETNPIYGSNNIVVGTNNTYLYSSGVIVGYNNNVSGVRNVVIGYNISGLADNTLYMGTNNSNKMILDNDKVVFNSGAVQDNFVVKSSNDATSVLNIGLNSNRVGINTDSPTSDLAVSGLTTTSSLRVGFSAPDAYVLTTNTNGVGTWQLPVRISGTDTGLLYRVNDKVASGISEILYSPSTKQMNFNLGGNNGFYITSTGVFVNDEASTYKLRVRGSGGVEFARVLLDTNFGHQRIDFHNISGNSGTFNNFTVNSGVNLPPSLTGTFLFVNNSGRLNSAATRANSIIFANENAWATGNTSIRWINSQQTLALGATGIVSYDSLFTNIPDSFYNIILSSNDSIDTVFNNRGLGNKFSVINSGSLNNRIGFHISPTGSVTINASSSDIANSNSSGVVLYANGKAWFKSLKIGEGATASGYYLRTDQFGNLRFSDIDLKTQFSGLYPMNITYTSQGDASFRVDIGLSNKLTDGSNMGANNDGTMLIWRGDAWVSSSGLKVYQNQTIANDPNSVRGIEFGYKPQVTQTRHNHVFAGGSIKASDEKYNGSSQYAQYYLRTRTTDGGQVRPLVTDWTKPAVGSTVVTTETTANCINLSAFSDATSYEYDRVWTYQIDISALWQLGSSSSVNPNATRNGAGIFIEGALIRTASGIRFSKLGTETTRTYGDTMPAGMSIGTQVVDSNPPRLSIVASGAAGYTAIWSATAKINQLNHVGSDPLYLN